MIHILFVCARVLCMTVFMCVGVCVRVLLCVCVRARASVFICTEHQRLHVTVINLPIKMCYIDVEIINGA